MENQELYQNFKAQLSSLASTREIDQWWSWVQDFVDFEDDEVQGQIDGVIQDLKNHRPIQYIFQKSFFYDLELEVNESVLIPRPETEELVAWVSENVESKHRILDIGTGSGAIALMIKKKHPSADVVGVDISKEALEVAQRNRERLQLSVSFEKADLFDLASFERLGDFDVIVSNPPYIAAAERDSMSGNTIHEPELALFAKNDDVVGVYKSILDISNTHLEHGGLLFLELNEFWLDKIQEMVQEMGKTSIVKLDMQGKARMLMVRF